MEKKDRRILKTERALKTALAELLQEKELKDITIRELTDRADIHRGTFYSHYQDIYELMEEIENVTLKNIDEHLGYSPSHDYLDYFTAFFDYAEKNREAFKILFSDNATNTIRHKFSQYLEEKTIAITLADEEMTIDEMSEKWRYLIRFGCEGHVALIERWVKNDFSYPKKELIQIASDIDKALDQLYD